MACRVIYSAVKAAGICVVALVFGVFFASGISAKEPPKPEHFSHATFDSLLQLNVRGGLILYAGFDTPAFEQYCSQLASATPAGWGAAERLAFWLNACNAMTIKAVIKRPGLKMANNFAGFFSADTFWVAGRGLSLQKIRDSILRTFPTPLVHFGAMLPAVGAPRLSARAFRAKNVVSELEKIARQYFRTEAGCVLDIGAKTLRLSWICREHRADFEAGGKSLLAAVLPYLEEKTAAFCAVYKDEITLDFLPFDWRVNARRDSGAEVETKPYLTRRDTAAAKSKSLKKK